MHGTARATVDLYRYVVGLAKSGLSNQVCFTELIDNALDAKATSVRVVVKNGKEVRIHDNGTGVPDIESLVCFGGHVAHRSTQSGMYGVGFKDAALCLGGEKSRVKVSTRSGGKRTECTIEWQRLRDSDVCMEWDSEPDADAAAGTEIAIQPMVLRFPDGERLTKFLAQLGYMYSPAIKRAAVIQITSGGKTHTLAPWKLPDLEDVVDAHIELNGKRARLYAGIVPKGAKNERPGLTYSHGFRVIKPASSFGCGSYSIARVCGFVDLDDKRSWARTKNKTDLVDADDLYEEIECLLRPLLEKAQAQEQSYQFDGLISELEAMLSSALLGDDAKARRREGDETGTKESKNTKRKHRRAREEQDGTTFPRGRCSEIKLQFREGWREEGTIGKWEANNRSARIVLFEDHPHVAGIRAARNTAAIFNLAMTIASFHIGVGGQEGFTLPRDVLCRLSDLTSRGVRLDGVPLAEAAE